MPGIGHVCFDIAYGGAFYALVNTPSRLALTPENFNQLIDYGRRITQTIIASCPIEHPFELDLSFLYGTILIGPTLDGGNRSRNVCIFADGELDRSPTGSGVSARAALHYARGELGLNSPITIESILGSTMSVAVTECTKFGPYDAVIPQVSGSAFIVWSRLHLPLVLLGSIGTEGSESVADQTHAQGASHLARASLVPLTRRGSTAET